MERKFLQIAVAVAGFAGAGLIFVPLLWLWQRHVVRVTLQGAVT